MEQEQMDALPIMNEPGGSLKVSEQEIREQFKDILKNSSCNNLGALVELNEKTCIINGKYNGKFFAPWIIQTVFFVKYAPEFNKNYDYRIVLKLNNRFQILYFSFESLMKKPAAVLDIIKASGFPFWGTGKPEHDSYLFLSYMGTKIAPTYHYVPYFAGYSFPTQFFWVYYNYDISPQTLCPFGGRKLRIETSLSPAISMHNVFSMIDIFGKNKDIGIILLLIHFSSVFLPYFKECRTGSYDFYSVFHIRSNENLPVEDIARLFLQIYNRDRSMVVRMDSQEKSFLNNIWESNNECLLISGKVAERLKKTDELVKLNRNHLFSIFADHIPASAKLDKVPRNVTAKSVAVLISDLMAENRDYRTISIDLPENDFNYNLFSLKKADSVNFGTNLYSMIPYLNSPHLRMVLERAVAGRKVEADAFENYRLKNAYVIFAATADLIYNYTNVLFPQKCPWDQETVGKIIKDFLIGSIGKDKKELSRLFLNAIQRAVSDGLLSVKKFPSTQDPAPNDYERKAVLYEKKDSYCISKQQFDAIVMKLMPGDLVATRVLKSLSEDHYLILPDIEDSSYEKDVEIADRRNSGYTKKHHFPTESSRNGKVYLYTFVKSILQESTYNYPGVAGGLALNAEKGSFFVGKDDSNQCIYWPFINGNMENRHILLTGKSGSGKTYCAQRFMLEALKNKVTCIVIDYSQSYLAEAINGAFKNSVTNRLNFISVKENGIGINLLKPKKIITGAGEQDENLLQTAQRFTDLMDIMFKFGPHQKAKICTVAETVLREGNFNPYRVFEVLQKDEDSNNQSILEKIRPFFKMLPFNPTISIDWNEIIKPQIPQITVFDLSGYSDAVQKQLSECLIKVIFEYAKEQTQSAAGNGNSPQNFVMVLDEAQKLSWTASSPASQVLAEGRKFGMSVWLATQSTSVFNRRDELSRITSVSARFDFAEPSRSSNGERAYFCNAYGEFKNDKEQFVRFNGERINVPEIIAE